MYIGEAGNYLVGFALLLGKLHPCATWLWLRDVFVTYVDKTGACRCALQRSMRQWTLVVSLLMKYLPLQIAMAD